MNRKILCRVFEEHVAELYWLAFLLTGDRKQSVQAFTNALYLDQANLTFQEFTLSGARKLIVVAALSTIRPQLRDSMLRTQQAAEDPDGCDDLPTPAVANHQSITKPDLENALLAIDLFPRCAVLLMVFEGLSAADTCMLLDSDEKLVKAAKRRGLIELTRNIVSARGRSRGHSPDYRPELLANWHSENASCLEYLPVMLS